jgi:hypothetical protein
VVVGGGGTFSCCPALVSSFRLELAMPCIEVHFVHVQNLSRAKPLESKRCTLPRFVSASCDPADGRMCEAALPVPPALFHLISMGVSMTPCAWC